MKHFIILVNRCYGIDRYAFGRLNTDWITCHVVMADLPNGEVIQIHPVN